jgi:hypothetical protein
MVDKETLLLHMKTGKKALEPLTGRFFGFRAPYLRYNDAVRSGLIENDCFFESSRSIFIKTPALSVPESAMAVIRELYDPDAFEARLSLPRYEESLIEIPVTLPDDEIIIDRLHIRDKKKLFRIFTDMAEAVFANEEVFVMQLHPERIGFLFDPLKELLSNLKSERNVWITDLMQLAQWFKKTSRLSCDLNREKKEIQCEIPEGRKIIGRNTDWTYSHGRIRYQSDCVPGIYMESCADKRLKDQLEADGFFVFTEKDMSSCCSVTVTEHKEFSAQSYRSLRHSLLETDKPLICLSRWPEDHKGVFCLSGDIDALTIGDFFSRFMHFSGTQ